MLPLLYPPIPPLVDLFDITVGAAMYGQDVMLQGMKFAVIARPQRRSIRFAMSSEK